MKNSKLFILMSSLIGFISLVQADHMIGCYPCSYTSALSLTDDPAYVEGTAAISDGFTAEWWDGQQSTTFSSYYWSNPKHYQLFYSFWLSIAPPKPVTLDSSCTSIPQVELISFSANGYPEFEIATSDNQFMTFTITYDVGQNTASCTYN